MSKKLFGKFFIFLLIVGLLFAVAPTRQALAQTPTTLNVAKWFGPSTLMVSGRQATIKVGDTYHMWYANAGETQLSHTSSTDPASFGVGTPNTFTGGTPVEVGSVTVLYEGNTYYMIAYETSTGGGNQKFAIYTSSDGNAWTYGGTVFDGDAAFSELTGFVKIDGPYLFKDDTKYRLYFQVKSRPSGIAYDVYHIYTAESTAASLSVIADGDAGAEFTLANNGAQVLSPDTNTSKWDGTCVMQPMVVKDGGTYYMWYSAHNSPIAGAQPQQIGFALSEDGYDWVKSPGNPVLSRAAYNAVGEPSVIKDGTTWRMWYLASDGIRYLTASGPFEFSTIQAAIDSATAGDTINVAAGEYIEDISMPFPVNLIGTGVPAPVIKGTLTIDHSFYSGSAATLIEGIAFVTKTDVKHDNIVLKGVEGITIKNCSFDGANKFMLDGARAIQMDNPVNKNVLIDNCTFTNGYYVTIQGNVDGLTVVDSAIQNVKSGINHQYGGNLVVTDTDFSVVAQDVDNDTYGIRFASSSGSASDLSVSGGSIQVDKDGLVADEGIYHSAIIIREGATGALTVDEVAIYGEVVNQSTTQLDASHNWWGSVAGPAAGQISGDVDYTPWCGDEDCSFLVSKNAQGELVLEGEIHATGGITIDQPGLTILLKNGTVIQNSSPCFIVEANNTTIKAEIQGGAVCVPTDGSNGIDVATGLTDITIEGLEINGTGQNTGDGIHFAGAISDIVLVNNKIHDLDGDGIEFADDVSEVVNIQGNMFKANGGLGINNLGDNTVGAEYNSWGNVAGPDAGDGVYGPVTSTPFTHADLYVVSSGTPWANQVVKGQQITYTVKAHLVNVNAADFYLEYPANLTYVSHTEANALGDDDAVTHDPVARKLHFIGYSTTGNKNGDLALFSVTFTADSTVVDAPLSFSYGVTSGFGMVGYESSSNVFVSEMVNGSVKIIDLPTLTSSDIQGYYLTGEPRDFHVSVSNPETGGNFVNSIYYVFTIQGAVIADLNSLTCKIDGSTDTPISMTEQGGNLIGRVGYAGAGFPMAPGFSTTTTCTANFNTAKGYVFTVDMVDNASTPVDFELATLSNTAVVYTKPDITATFPIGPYVAGVPVTVPISITNPSSIPGPFSLILTLPAGTTFTFSGETYTCAAETGCPAIPVILPLATSNLVITFPGAFSGDVVFNLYDSDWTPAPRLLATFTKTEVIVLGAFDVTGTVSMQGRSAREGVQLILTGPSDFAYGPYTATSTASISNNYIFENVAAETYTFTTNQPRYLNITADLEKTVNVYANVTLAPLTLIGGNAIYNDNVINYLDLGKVGSGYTYGIVLHPDADVNFDNLINIQDLALVGGNYDLTSASAYGTWQP